MVVIQEHSMATETDTVAPTVTTLTFDRSKQFWMLRWCDLKPTQEKLIPSAWQQLKVETTKTGKKYVLTHLLDTSNMGYEEVNIFLSKKIVTNITNQNFVLRYTTAYRTPHHGVT